MTPAGAKTSSSLRSAGLLCSACSATAPLPYTCVYGRYGTIASSLSFAVAVDRKLLLSFHSIELNQRNSTDSFREPTWFASYLAHCQLSTEFSEQFIIKFVRCNRIRHLYNFSSAPNAQTSDQLCIFHHETATDQPN